ncbi:beta-N-acetylhexosaminidase [Enterobacteriaceae bacterium LUAb1]
MKIFRVKRLALTLMILAGCSQSTRQSDQQIADQMSQFSVQYQVTDNLANLHGVNCAALGADWASCNRATIKLTNPGQALTSKNWAIYMSNVHESLKAESEQFKFTRIVGDLTRLEPTDKFQGFAAGETVEIPVIHEYWQVFISDIMPRWYVTVGKAQPKVIASTDTEDLTQFVLPFGEQWKKSADDQNVLMTPQARFAKNHDVLTLSPRMLRGQIIPTPQKISVYQQDADLSRGVAFHLSDLSPSQQQAISDRFQLLGVSRNAQGYPVQGWVDATTFHGDQATEGAYRLNITSKGATVIGFNDNGVFYGLMSIASLLPAQGPLKIATLQAEDAPRFAYRGLFLDVGRNFHSKAVVLKLLDQMAAYKLNTFHFHLSDDEGWRIEIPGLPELTDVGSKRCHDLSEQHCLLPQLGSGPDSTTSGSGYFSRSDYIAILKYAQARGIEVIPEIDMPAHARAAVVSMEARYQRLIKAGQPKAASEYRLLDPGDTSNTTSVQYYDRTSYLNPCLDSSRRFVSKVIGEIQGMHREAGVPLTTWHFGGDEAKNIRLGAGYTDQKHPEPGKGIVDRSRQDKPWAKSARCQAYLKSGRVEDLEHLPGYFAQEVSKIVNAHGISKMQAWQDGLKAVKNAHAFATPHISVNFWDTLFWGGFDSVNDWENKGFDVIISNPDYVYMDFPYEVNPLERGYYWGTRYSDERKVFSFAPDNLPQNAETSVDRDGKFFSAKSDKPWHGAYGLSGQLWSETVRTDEQVQYMLFPRVLSVAERSWHRASWEQNYQAGREYVGGKTHYVDRQLLQHDWQRFANLLGQRELAKLDKAGITYRIPQPGAKIVDGVLQANTALPGTAIEYATEGSHQWQRYNDKARPQVAGKVRVRAVSSEGKRYSRVEVVTLQQ